MAVNGKGFFVTTPLESNQELLVTRIGSFRHSEQGYLINRYNEALMILPTTSSGTPTSTSLNSAFPLNIPHQIVSSNGTNSPLSEIDISDSGVVSGNYADEAQIFGIVTLVDFNNPHELLEKEKTSSLEMVDLTHPLTGQATTSSFGEIQHLTLKTFNPHSDFFPYSISINGTGSIVTYSPDTEQMLLSTSTKFRTNHSGLLVNEFDEWVQISETSEPVFNNLWPLMLPNAADLPQASTEITFATNLAANAQLLNPTEFDPSSSSTFSYSTTLTLFDALGEDHLVSIYFLKVAELEWAVYFVTTDQTNNHNYLNVNGGFEGGDQRQYAKLFFESSGQYSLSMPNSLQIEADFKNGSDLQIIEVLIDTESTSQSQGPFTINVLEQDGYAIGRFLNLDIDSSGTISKDLSNRTEVRNTVIGLLPLLTVANDNCLLSLESSDSKVISDSCDTTISAPLLNDFGEVEFSELEY